MRKWSTIIYSGSGWDLTVRELMFSIVIILVMLTGGFFISEKISSSCDNKNEEYYQAIKIDNDAEQFQYGMRTNVGNAFVKGTLSVVDPVTDSDIDGEYAYIEVRGTLQPTHQTGSPYDNDKWKIPHILHNGNLLFVGLLRQLGKT